MLRLKAILVIGFLLYSNLLSASFSGSEADRILSAGVLGGVGVALLLLFAHIARSVIDRTKNTVSKHAPEAKALAGSIYKSVREKSKGFVTSDFNEVSKIDDEYFIRAEQEIKTNTQVEGLWLRCKSLAQGNKEKQEAIYLKQRAKELQEKQQAEQKAEQGNGEGDNGDNSTHGNEVKDDDRFEATDKPEINGVAQKAYPLDNYCPQCGFSNLQGVNYCASCSKNLSLIEENSVDEFYGVIISNETSESRENEQSKLDSLRNQPYPTSEEKKKKGDGFVAALILVAIAIGTTILVVIENPFSKKTSALNNEKGIYEAQVENKLGSENDWTIKEYENIYQIMTSNNTEESIFGIKIQKAWCDEGYLYVFLPSKKSIAEGYLDRMIDVNFSIDGVLYRDKVSIIEAGYGLTLVGKEIVGYSTINALKDGSNIKVELPSTSQLRKFYGVQSGYFSLHGFASVFNTVNQMCSKD